MRDTALGIVGVLLIVGGMLGALQARESPLVSTDDDVGTDVRAAPPVLGTDAWSAAGCRALILSWNPPLAELASYTHPWSPAPSAVPGRGTFSLYVFTCPEMMVSGVAEAGSTGALISVPIEAVGDVDNVSAPATSAQLDAIGWGERLHGAYARQGFVVTHGSAGVTFAELPLGGTIASFSVTTAEGALDGQATFAGPASAFTFVLAWLAPREDRLSLLHGSGDGQEVLAGGAAVTSTGSTWMSRLGLEPAPARARLTLDEVFDLTLESRLAGR